MVFFIGLMNATLKTIYAQSGKRIKKFAENVNLGFAKLTPTCTVLPIFFGSLANYFTTDLGADALELPYPTMW